MSVKYIKDRKTQEVVYPITKSECIVDAHSINNYEIDQLFDGSPEYESSDSGMDYLNYNGLKHYHKKISEEVQTGLDNVQVDLTGYATESWVEGKNYLTEHQDISGKVDIEDLNGYATQQWVEAQNYLKEHQDISNKVDVSDFEEATRVTAEALNLFHSNTLWQTEDTYVKCDKSKTLEEALSGESDVVYFTTDSHQIILNGVVYSLQDISGKVDVTDFEEYKLAISATINTLNQDLAAKESDIQLLQAQVLELQNQISTLMG